MNKKQHFFTDVILPPKFQRLLCFVPTSPFILHILLIYFFHQSNQKPIKVRVAEGLFCKTQEWKRQYGANFL